MQEKYKYLFLVLTLLMIMAGCEHSGPKVYINHQPAPNHLLILSSEEFGITIYSQTLVHYTHKEDDESERWVRQTDLREKVVLTNEDDQLSIALRVANDKKIEYSVVFLYSTRLKGEDEEFEYEEELYRGDFSLKNFNFLCKTDDTLEGVYRIEIRDKDGELIIATHSVEFVKKVKGGGNSNK